MEVDSYIILQTTKYVKSLHIGNPSLGFIPFPQPKNIDDEIQRVDGENLANDIFENLFLDEMEKRPKKSYMEKVQKHICPPTRACFIDLLADVAHKLCDVPNTLHLAVNYMDRYLSRNEVDLKEFQLLGLTCMIIASKYEEVRTSFDFDAYICISKDVFSRKDFIQMEKSVLSCLNYELTTPTTWSYIERFVRAAQGGKQSPAVHRLECMAGYIAELSLLSYDMLKFLPSKIAASSVFLALYILDPSKRPWNATLVEYTVHRPSQLRDCVLALHGFCYKVMRCSSNMSTIRSKYSQQKYECVALKSFPQSIPPEFFQNL